MARRELAIGVGANTTSGPGKPAEVAKDAAALLSALALAGAEDEAAAAKAFSIGAAQLALPDEWVRFTAATDFSRLGDGLGRLAACNLTLRQQVVRAGAAVIDADGVRTPEELELLRATAAALGCPMSLPV
jgi:tellurite resistance protein